MFIKDLVGIFCTLAMVSAIILIANSTPVVQYRYGSGECVQVIPAKAGSCQALPKRYEREWVAPNFVAK